MVVRVVIVDRLLHDASMLLLGSSPEDIDSRDNSLKRGRIHYVNYYHYQTNFESSRAPQRPSQRALTVAWCRAHSSFVRLASVFPSILHVLHGDNQRKIGCSISWSRKS